MVRHQPHLLVDHNYVHVVYLLSFLSSDTVNSLSKRVSLTASALRIGLSIYTSFFLSFEPRFRLLFESRMLIKFGRINSARNSAQGDRIFSIQVWPIETAYALMITAFQSTLTPWINY